MTTFEVKINVRDENFNTITIFKSDLTMDQINKLNNFANDLVEESENK